MYRGDNKASAHRASKLASTIYIVRIDFTYPNISRWLQRLYYLMLMMCVLLSRWVDGFKYWFCIEFHLWFRFIHDFFSMYGYVMLYPVNKFHGFFVPYGLVSFVSSSFLDQWIWVVFLPAYNIFLFCRRQYRVKRKGFLLVNYRCHYNFHMA